MDVILKNILNWLELHPASAAGFYSLLGIILSAILDLRKHAINSAKIVKKEFNKHRQVSVIIGSHNRVQQSFANEEPRNEINPLTLISEYKGPLTKIQREICSRIKDLSSRFSESFEIESMYEDAVKSLNMNEITSASGKFVQLFKKTTESLQVVAQNNDATFELNQLVTVNDGLFNMINEKEDEDLIRQIQSCESITFKLLVKLPA